MRFSKQKSTSNFHSKENNSLTLTPKTPDIFNDKVVEGTYLPFSIELIVCRDTPNNLAKSSCVKLFLARSTFILFFIFITLNNSTENGQ